MRFARIHGAGLRPPSTRPARSVRSSLALLLCLLGACFVAVPQAGAATRPTRPKPASKHAKHSTQRCKKDHRCPKHSAPPPKKHSSGSSSSGSQPPSAPPGGSTTIGSQPSPVSTLPSSPPSETLPVETPKQEEPPKKEEPKKEAPKEEPKKEEPKKEAPKEEPKEEAPKKEEPPAEPLRLFSAESIYNEELPASPPQATDSAQLVAAFQAQVSKYYGHVVINTTEWSTPVYVVPANQPTVAMLGVSSICPRPEGVFSGFQAQIEAVPIPSNASPAAGTDKEVVIWQPSTGHLWELWRVLQEGGRWTACWGGEIADAYTSDGIFPAPFGASAAGLSLLGGQIHLEDLERGSINHALEVLLPETLRTEFVWPAVRTDGNGKTANSIPEGTRFRLKASVNLSSLGLSKPALEIATAIQRYGLIVADTAGAVTLSAQDPTPLIKEGKANPYNTLLGSDPDDVLDAVPWGDLEVVSPSYHG